MRKIISVLFITMFSYVYSQNNLPVNVIQPRNEISYFNNIEAQRLVYADTADNKNLIVTILNKSIRSIESESTSNQRKIKFDLHKGRIVSFNEWENHQVNGCFIVFNKGGKVDLILKYKQGKLVGVVYYRKKTVLDKYCKKFGVDSPYTETVEIKKM
ncbi:MAG TPA: hypothetical protein VN698_03115 [Bacteroidia bacterium]|nr:hypothetical protein [Bacteroidia bacterium]